jgi:peptide deformylase
MNNFSIRIYGDPVLKKVSQPITNIDGSVVNFSNFMAHAMRAAQGIGLAAPQVGRNIRIVTIDREALEIGKGVQILINPVIKYVEGDSVMEEGCLSIPGLYWDVTRPKKVVIQALELTPKGNVREVEIEAYDLYARVILHEIDHLDGILFVDRLPPDEKRIAIAQWKRRMRSGRTS